MSAIRNASRAALAVASAGVSSAAGSRCFARAGAFCGSSGISRIARRATGSVKKINETASSTLNAVWKFTTSRCGSGSRPASSPCIGPSSGMVIRQPITRKNRLPSATRRPALPAPAVARSAMRPLPRFAPSTRKSATLRAIRPLATNAAVSSTMARLDQAATLNSAPTSRSSIGSPVSEPRITFTPAAWVSGFVACRIICSARMIRPTPMEMRPIWPMRVPLRDRWRITPPPIASGESHDRSNENSCTTRLVPTSAPSMIASAGASPIRFCDTNELAMSAVALEDCTSAVTPRPARNA